MSHTDRSTAKMQPYRTRVSADDEPHVAIIEALAAASNTAPAALDVQLYDYVATDALEAAYRHAAAHESAEWTFEFTVDEFDVTLHSDGQLTIA